MNRRLFCLLIFSLGIAVNFSFGYTIILKNGKTIQGTLVSENTEMYVVKDSSGIQLNLRKTAVDLEKTLSANQASTSSTNADVKPVPKEESKPEQTAAPAPKHAARKFTEEDLEKLREKYDLGSGMTSDSNSASENDPEKTDEKNKNKEKGHSADDLRNEAATLREVIKHNQEAYENLKEGCDFAAGMTPQAGDTATNKKGERLNIAEERKKICDEADIAKMAVEKAQSQYQELIQSAVSEGVSQDWLENH